MSNLTHRIILLIGVLVISIIISITVNNIHKRQSKVECIKALADGFYICEQLFDEVEHQ